MSTKTINFTFVTVDFGVHWENLMIESSHDKEKKQVSLNLTI